MKEKCNFYTVPHPSWLSCALSQTDRISGWKITLQMPENSMLGCASWRRVFALRFNLRLQREHVSRFTHGGQAMPLCQCLWLGGEESWLNMHSYQATKPAALNIIIINEGIYISGFMPALIWPHHFRISNFHVWSSCNVVFGKDIIHAFMIVFSVLIR